MDNINKKIKSYRKSQGWTQEYVANRLGISQPAYQKIEAGDSDSMRVSTLRKICIEFKLNPSWLLGFSDIINLE